MTCSRHLVDQNRDDLLAAVGDIGLAPAVGAVLGLDPAQQQVLRAAGAEDKAFDAGDLHGVAFTFLAKPRHRGRCFGRSRPRRDRCSGPSNQHVDRASDGLAVGPLAGHQHDPGLDLVADLEHQPDLAAVVVAAAPWRRPRGRAGRPRRGGGCSPARLRGGAESRRRHRRCGPGNSRARSAGAAASARHPPAPVGSGCQSGIGAWPAAASCSE